MSFISVPDVQVDMTNSTADTSVANFKSTVDSANRARDRKRIERSMKLPEEGMQEVRFYDRASNCLIAMGYERMVYGDHGPYIECKKEALFWQHFELIKAAGGSGYYDFYKSKDTGVTQAYLQVKDVGDKPNPAPGRASCSNNRPEGYADYQPGLVYISPKHVVVEFIETGERRTLAPPVEKNEKPISHVQRLTEALKDIPKCRLVDVAPKDIRKVTTGGKDGQRRRYTRLPRAQLASLTGMSEENCVKVSMWYVHDKPLAITVIKAKDRVDFESLLFHCEGVSHEDVPVLASDRKLELALGVSVNQILLPLHPKPVLKVPIFFSEDLPDDLVLHARCGIAIVIDRDELAEQCDADWIDGLAAIPTNHVSAGGSAAQAIIGGKSTDSLGVILQSDSKSSLDEDDDLRDEIGSQHDPLETNEDHTGLRRSEQKFFTNYPDNATPGGLSLPAIAVCPASSHSSALPTDPLDEDGTRSGRTRRSSICGDVNDMVPPPIAPVAASPVRLNPNAIGGNSAASGRRGSTGATLFTDMLTRRRRASLPPALVPDMLPIIEQEISLNSNTNSLNSNNYNNNSNSNSSDSGSGPINVNSQRGRRASIAFPIVESDGVNVMNLSLPVANKRDETYAASFCSRSRRGSHAASLSDQLPWAFTAEDNMNPRTQAPDRSGTADSLNQVNVAGSANGTENVNSGLDENGQPICVAPLTTANLEGLQQHIQKQRRRKSIDAYSEPHSSCPAPIIPSSCAMPTARFNNVTQLAEEGYSNPDANSQPRKKLRSMSVSQATEQSQSFDGGEARRRKLSEPFVPPMQLSFPTQ